MVHFELECRVGGDRMKIRLDYVTNSSSSSFIMAFKDEYDFDEFRDACITKRFREVYRLMQHMQKNSAKKDEVKETVFRYYSWNMEEELLKKVYGNVDDLSYYDKYELMKKADFQERLKKEVENNQEYIDAIKRIDESEIVFDGMIWDTNGGILEWAIRNGLLTDEFPQWCLLNWNVG